MLFEWIFGRRTTPAAEPAGAPGPVPLVMVRNPRARRYLLRLQSNGIARVTIPRGGSTDAARQFVKRHAAWLEQEFQRLQARPRQPSVWRIGTRIFLRGNEAAIEAVPGGEGHAIRLGGESLRVPDPAADLRPAIEKHLRGLAARELPSRLLELAARHGLTVNRITIRGQKSRWGSCSRRGTISLNWRLIQLPPFVSDYICLHELMHLRQMNHSREFWREVERACPDFHPARRWLKEHPGLLR